MNMIEFNNTSFTYRGDWLQKIKALNSVSFSVPEGSAFGFLGANGAGKSTAIKIINGLLIGHEGDIKLFGKELGSPEIRRETGYLPEQPFFYENLQVHEYLAYLGKLSGMSNDALEKSCERLYEILDLGELKNRKLGSFSKGMRQRFGLASAILHNPKLIILDEPFSGLDPLWRARFKQILKDESKRGATLFFSSHILSDVEDICDGYSLIDHGKILESGKIADLFSAAPLKLIGEGNMPEGATKLEDNKWSLIFNDHERKEKLESITNSGGSIVRLESQKIALEDYFVSKVKESHSASKP